NYFLIFMVAMLLISIYVFITRYPLIRKETNPIESYFSKESSFLLNNLILVAGAFAVFWGTMYPLFSEALTGVKVNVGPPYFTKVMAPIMFALIVLMAVCPLIAWQKAKVKRFIKTGQWPFLAGLAAAAALVAAGVEGPFAIIGLGAAVFMFAVHVQEFMFGIRARRKVTKESMFSAAWKLMRKNQRRYGGYIVHIGVAVIAVGVIASHAYSDEMLTTLEKGETARIGDFALTFKGFSERMENGNGIVAADMDISYKGKSAGTVRPEKIFYSTWPEPS